MIEELKKALNEHPENPFLQGHVEALENADEKLREAAYEAAMKVPEDQVEDGIKWTERYLETLKFRNVFNGQNRLESEHPTMVKKLREVLA